MSRLAAPRVAPGSLFAALLAVAAQIMLGALGPAGIASRDAAAGAERVAVICHAPDPGDPAVPAAPAPRHGLDCLLCPLCQTLAPAAAVLASATALPAPRLVALGIATPPPPARAPPPAPLAAAYPRGPPVLQG
jgi:hypothetical protein